MKRLLNEKESAEAGFAVEVVLTILKRMLNGSYFVSADEAVLIEKAFVILDDYSQEEQIELFQLGLLGEAE